MGEKVPTRKISRADPFGEVDLLERWGPFGSLFSDAARGAFGARGGPGAVVPAMDVSESEKAFVITAELPGTNADDVSLELHDDILTIRGEKRDERSGEDEQRRWSERIHGTFARSFSLPGNADPERVSASFTNGVLTIEVAKREETKPKVIRIQE